MMQPILILILLALPLSAFRSTSGSESKASEVAFHLTFDDGPNLEHGPHMIEVLKKHDVQATFFFVGVNIPLEAPHHSEQGLPPPYEQTEEQRRLHATQTKSMMPAHVRHIARSGHVVASHTMKHWNKYDRFPDVFEEDVHNMTQLLKNVTGVRPTIFRAPYGKANTEMHQRLKKLGYRLDLRWKVDLRDWKCGDHGKNIRDPVEKDRIQRDCVVNAFRNHYPKGGRTGGVVLLHQSKHTTFALDEVLTYLKGLGYNFLPLAAFVTPEEREALWEDHKCEEGIERQGEDYIFFETCQSFHRDYEDTIADLQRKRHAYLVEHQDDEDRKDTTGGAVPGPPPTRPPSSSHSRPQHQNPPPTPSAPSPPHPSELAPEKPTRRRREDGDPQDMVRLMASVNSVREKLSAQTKTLDRLVSSLSSAGGSGGGSGESFEKLKLDLERLVDEKMKSVHRAEADKLYVMLEDRLTRDDLSNLVVVGSIVVLGLCWFCAFRLKREPRRGLKNSSGSHLHPVQDSPV